MNKTTLTALFFLVLYFVTKPLAYTYPTIDSVKEADFAWAPFYESDEEDLIVNGSTSQAPSFCPLNDKEEQEKFYI